MQKSFYFNNKLIIWSHNTHANLSQNIQTNNICQKKKNYMTQFYSYEIVAKYVILKIFQQINAHKASRSLTVKHGGQCYFNKSTAELK